MVSRDAPVGAGGVRDAPLWRQTAPERVALLDDAGNTTTREQLLRLVAAHEIVPNLATAARVAIVGEPGLAVSSLVAATYLAGRAFSVIDSLESDELTQRLMTDFAADVVVEVGGSTTSEPVDGPPHISYDDIVSVANTVDTPAGRDLFLSPSDDLAYSVRSSGTTGEPKLLAMSRAAIEQFSATFTEHYKLDECDTLAVWAVPTYDAHYCQLFSALRSGAVGAVADRMTRATGGSTFQWLEKLHVTHFQTTPTVLDALVRAATARSSVLPARLRVVMCHGERFPPELAARLLALQVNAATTPEIFNEYGPSECILATWHAVSLADVILPDLPIGTAIPGRQVTVEPDTASPVGPATADLPGEIIIESPYLCLAESTEAKMAADDASVKNMRRYHTGDFGYFDAQQRLRLVGRRDRVVKRRGVKLSLDQVEAAFERLDEVRQAAARADPNTRGDIVMTAWVVPATEDVDEAVLRRRVAEAMELRYQPDIIKLLPTMPRLRSGKVDYQSLPFSPALESSDTVVTSSDDVQSEDQDVGLVVAEEVGRLLAMPDVGERTNFFASGGHSLAALELVARLAARLGTSLTLRDVLLNPTVSGIANAVRDLACSDAQASPVAIEEATREDGIRQLTAAERPLWAWSQLFPEDGAANVIGGFRAPTNVTRTQLKDAVRELVAQVSQLRLRYPETGAGPIRVIGVAVEPEVHDLAIEDAVGDLSDPQLRRLLYRPFDVRFDQLLRAVLVRPEPTSDEASVLLVVHHLICDGPSMRLLLGAIHQLLASAGTRLDLGSLCLLPMAARPKGLEQRGRQPWSLLRNHLAASPVVDWLRPDANVASEAATQTRWSLSSVALRSTAARWGVSRPALLVALVGAALHELEVIDQLVVDTPVSLRTGAEQHVVGNFVVNLPILLTPRNLPLEQLATVAHEQVVELVAHAEWAPGYGWTRPGQKSGPVGDVVVVLDDHMKPNSARTNTAEVAVQGSPPRHGLALYFDEPAGSREVDGVIFDRTSGSVGQVLPAALKRISQRFERASNNSCG